MSVDGPNASWHPALMPNSASDLSSFEFPSIPSASSFDPTSSAEAAEASTQEDRGSLSPSTEADESALGSAHDEKPVSDEGVHPTSSVEPADASTREDRGSSSPSAEPEESALDSGHDEKPASDEGVHGATDPAAAGLSRAFSWGDEEDDQWIQEHKASVADPFSELMPNTDRTNSFPAVPPLKSQEPVGAPSEVPKLEPILDVQVEDDEEAPVVAADDDLDNETAGPEAYIGGDSMRTEESAEGARYEEGIPLISEATAAETAEEQAAEAAPTALDDALGDLGAGDDDFFSQLQQDSAEASEDTASQPHLTRKSTMQVIGAMKTGPVDVMSATLEQDEEEAEATKSPSADDLAAKWKDALGEDDDELLPDDSTPSKPEVDEDGFLPSDDDGGFVEDSQDEPRAPAPAEPAHSSPTVAAAKTTAAGRASQDLTSRYAPPNVVAAASAPAAPVNPYAPPPFQLTPQPATIPVPTNTFGQAPQPPYMYQPQAPQPEPPKVSSFADKSKGGYQSPYDLPMQVVKPRKRASLQQLPKATAPPVAPPPRSSSMLAQAPPPAGPPMGGPPRAAGQPPAQPSRASTSSSFFEDLPIVTKPRPSSRQSNKSLPSPSQSQPPPPPPSQTDPYAPMPASQVPTAHQPPRQPGYGPAQMTSVPPPSQPTGIADLVAPERVSPYAPLHSGPQTIPPVQNPYTPQSGPQTVPPVPSPYAPLHSGSQTVPPVPTSSSRYSPAPASTASAPTTRYSPAPGLARPPSGGHSAAVYSAAAPALAHQPRTSSPLAHYEISGDRSQQQAFSPTSSDGSHSDRRTSSHAYDPRLHRVSSLPPTQELPEDDAAMQRRQLMNGAGAPPPMPAPDPRSAKPLPQGRTAHTPPPPPPNGMPHGAYSPSKQAQPPQAPPPPMGLQSRSSDLGPPPRSQTQSPGSRYGPRNASKQADPIARPSSVQSPPSPTASRSAAPSTASGALPGRPRDASLSLNYIPPADETAGDPLQRWKGAPVFSWGIGGTIVTSFPKDVPRYGAGQAVPMYVRSPGEVRVRNIRDHHPLEERLAKFPGPLKGKSKKKETLAWLSSGIDELERLLPNLAFQTNLSHDDKRAVERILLWKILRVFVEFDGTLEGSPAVNEAVRSILAPTARAVDTSSPVYATGAGISGLSESAPTRMQSDSTVDSSAIEHIRNLLLVGESEKAAWAAADRRLWGQALLISGAVSRDLYKQVAREFVRKEINYPGHNNESMAMLYQVLAGNHDECVDELVPVHARAGLQLVSTSATGGPHRDALAGLDQWRETLCLILNTRSPDDALGLKALGNLLTSYGRAEAGHICFLFARHHSVFGGIDDPSADFVLLGSDHRRQPDQFGKEIEALLLSEVYEYGLTLSGNSSHSMSGSPHLSAYKLQHAVTLAEYGYRDKALQYCEAISTAITAQTKRSPYHHYKLEQAVEDLLARLKQAPTEQSTSWLPKPSMNKVSDTMWNRFNKFVAGEENDGSGAGSPAEGPESGPFARIAGGTPTISRPPSVSNFETYGAPPGMPPYAGGPTNHGSPAGQVSRAASRYAPTSAQPATTANRYEPGAAYAPPVRQDTMNSTSSYDYSSQQSGGRQGYGASPAVNYGYQPQDYGVSREESYMSSLQLDSMSSSQSQPTYGQQHPVENGQNGTLQQPSGYGPYDAAPPANQTATTSAAAKQEPEEPAHMPSYGYEPPSTSLEPSSNSQEPQTQTSEEERQATSGYEPPSYQPYSYEPPSYQPDPEPAADGDDENSEPKLKKKSFMDEDDDDDIPALKPKDPKEKTKEEKDRENEEMFRRIAEEDAKRAAAQQPVKRGWFGGWFGGSGSSSGTSTPGKSGESTQTKWVRAKLGEENKFVYDKELGRWVNKGAKGDEKPKTATPPPPKGPPSRTASASAAGPTSAPSVPAETGRSSAPPPSGGPGMGGAPDKIGAQTSTPPPGGGLSAPPMMRSVSNASSAGGGIAPPSNPPSRPATSMSNASSIDDLLGAAGPRKRDPAAAKKARKGRGYVDVMAKP